MHFKSFINVTAKLLPYSLLRYYLWYIYTRDD